MPTGLMIAWLTTMLLAVTTLPAEAHRAQWLAAVFGGRFDEQRAIALFETLDEDAGASQRGALADAVSCPRTLPPMSRPREARRRARGPPIVVGNERVDVRQSCCI